MKESSLKNLKPFTKDDPRINRSGRPKTKYPRGQHPNSRANLNPWKKGQSGNPSGAPKLSPYRKRLIKRGLEESPSYNPPPVEYQFKKNDPRINRSGRPKVEKEKYSTRDVINAFRFFSGRFSKRNFSSFWVLANTGFFGESLDQFDKDLLESMRREFLDE